MESQSNPDIFEAARDRFIDSLSPEDRLLYSPCVSAEDFREAVKKLEATVARVGRRGKPMRCVYTLSKRLEPYFEVMNIFIQSNPQYSALFWGAFRLVLQVGLIFCALSDWTRSDVRCSCQVISPLSWEAPGAPRPASHFLSPVRGGCEAMQRWELGADP